MFPININALAKVTYITELYLACLACHSSSWADISVFWLTDPDYNSLISSATIVLKTCTILCYVVSVQGAAH